MTGVVCLTNGRVAAEVAPGMGGAILSFRDVATGLSVLGTVPWDWNPHPPAAAPMTEPDWLPHYTGGWPILFPNGGEACVIDGVAHGFHGEGSVVPWVAEAGAASLTLTRHFATVPVTMRRHIALEGRCLTVTTTATARAPVTAIWGEHVTFGSDLLAGPFRIEAGPARLRADPGYDPPESPLRPGATGDWPHLPGRDGGPVDLSRPQAGWAALAYLADMARPEITVARDDGRLAATLGWEGEVFDCLWLWVELGGTPAPPWNGKARLLGLEPCSTAAGHGLAQARERGDRIVRLEPGRPVRAALRLRLEC